MLTRDTVALFALSPGQGDTHNGGKTVSIIDSDAGQIDEPLHIKVPKVLDKGDHGWAQFITHEYAADEAECRQFYWR